MRLGKRHLSWNELTGSGRSSESCRAQEKAPAAVNPGALREIERGAAYRPVFPARVVYLRHPLIFQASTVSALGLLELPEGNLSAYAVLRKIISFLESRMNAAHIQPTFRGVSCRFCQKPIRLSASFIQREITIKQAGSGLGQELCSRVFAMRCRACQGEAIYALGHIVDFSQSSGEPPSWVRHLDRFADSGSRSE